MNKYLEFATSEGKRYVPIGSGLLVERTSSTAMKLYTACSLGNAFTFVTVDSTSAMVDVINQALIAAENSSSPFTPVILPDGETITTVRVL
jgi:hypothetical protein|tara:strand:+ start:395 stop:667 length:273 start_codon:yes stop_codon:yes gene_type:complete